MIVVHARLRSLSPYSQSSFFRSEKNQGESPDAFEARCWREKMHVQDGSVIIPPMALKNALDSASSFLNIKIKGERNRTWAKVFGSGVMVTDPLVLGIDPAKVEGEWLMCNADGKRGSGTRVKRCFPVIPKWEAEATIHVLNPKITEDIFRKHLVAAGKFIGFGRFRPENRGFYGRFDVTKLEWLAAGEEDDLADVA